jgi:phosphatidylglycerophosphate synthase
LQAKEQTKKSSSIDSLKASTRDYKMIDEPFRKILPNYSQKVVGFYRALGLSPNQVTLIGLALGVLSAFLITQGFSIAALLVWWLGRLADGTDGIYARETSQSSLFGAYLDIVCDMLAYSLMILAFAQVHPSLSLWWQGILLLYVLCITTALALGSLQEKAATPSSDNRGLRLGAGLAEGGETGLAYSLFLLFPVYIEPLVMVWVGVLCTTVVSRSLLARAWLGRS